MDAVYELKDMLCEELEEYGKKDKLDVGGLEIVDKLAHTIKNPDIMAEVMKGLMRVAIIRTPETWAAALMLGDIQENVAAVGLMPWQEVMEEAGAVMQKGIPWADIQVMGA